MYYFAYGSNMLSERLNSRVGKTKDVGVATLKGYSLKFNKQSKDGSGKANIIPDKESEVLGVVYELTEEQKKKLDRNESGYSRKILEIKLGSYEINMETYVANRDTVNDNLLPNYEYLNYLIQGAVNYGLPEIYIETLKQVKTLN